MKADSRLVEPAFVMHYLNSDAARRIARGAAFGTTRQRLTLPLFRKTPVPLPPIEEQLEIVAEVERRMSIVDELGTQVEADLKRAARLRQSILKWSFAGRLVPQDPNDEPAEKQLERILATRNATSLERDGETGDNAGRGRTGKQVRRGRRASGDAPGREP
jgi:type I restriction enzyme S subunit